MNTKPKQNKSKKASGRAPVISKAAASGKLLAITKDPKKAEDFLKSAGIITRAGKLSARYA